jgi:hypothetical protein
MWATARVTTNHSPGNHTPVIAAVRSLSIQQSVGELLEII